MTKLCVVVGLLFFVCLSGAIAEPEMDPARMDIYVTPYYNSQGPDIQVGQFSAGLAAEDEKAFVATIAEMKTRWQELSFPELYVAAIRLYDLGYRKESIYWFYTAQFRGRQLAELLDGSLVGSIGDPGFELIHAQRSFQQLVGPYINGYAFGDPDGLVAILERVQREAQAIPDMKAVYPRISFKAQGEWAALNTQIIEGLGELAEMIKTHKDQIRQQRIEHGIEAKFSKLQSRELSGE